MLRERTFSPSHALRKGSKKAREAFSETGSLFDLTAQNLRCRPFRPVIDHPGLKKSDSGGQVVISAGVAQMVEQWGPQIPSCRWFKSSSPPHFPLPADAGFPPFLCPPLIQSSGVRGREGVESPGRNHWPAICYCASPALISFHPELSPSPRQKAFGQAPKTMSGSGGAPLDNGGDPGTSKDPRRARNAMTRFNPASGVGAASGLGESISSSDFRTQLP